MRLELNRVLIRSISCGSFSLLNVIDGGNPPHYILAREGRGSGRGTEMWGEKKKCAEPTINR